MKISKLIYELKKIDFGMYVEFGQMKNKSMKFPFGDGIELFANSRSIYDSDLVNHFDAEIKFDLASINRNYGQIDNFGIYFYKLPDSKDSLIRYVKAFKTL